MLKKDSRPLFTPRGYRRVSQRAENVAQFPAANRGKKGVGSLIPVNYQNKDSRPLLCPKKK